jgi:hypothetical protein
MALSLTRPGASAQFFDSWDQYLSSWVKDGESSLCRAIAGNYYPLVKADWQAVVDEIDDCAKQEVTDTQVQAAALNDALALRDFTRQRVGFPWITPVLGSGCLSAAEGPEARAIGLVPELAALAVADWGVLPDRVDKRDAVKRFAEALVHSKLASSDSKAADAGSVVSPTSVDHAVAGRALLCGYLLARLYFEVGALKEEPMESSSSPLEFDPRLDGPTPRGAEIYEALVAPLLHELASLKSAIEERRDVKLKFVAKFTDAVGADLRADPPRIRGADAELMAEIAWHFMAEGTTQYPGWSDLLVLLGFAFDSTDRRHRWPHLTDLRAARKQLNDELMTTTELSWQARKALGGELDQSPETGASSRDLLYDTVARLLGAQANLRPPSRESQASLQSPSLLQKSREVYPPAVAFVTSFDLELEMALLARRQRFLLVLPFYTRREGSDAAGGYVWLKTEIAPSGSERLTQDDLKLLTRPAAWSLVSTRLGTQDERLDIPVVVRLAGSPLVEGPDLTTETGDWATKLKRQLGTANRLIGTVLLDEHTALQQWAADLGTLASAETAKDRLALPRSFVSGMSKTTDARFWFLLGVQLNDDAVRHRMAATIGAADLRSMIGEREEQKRRPLRAGVVVNRRSTPNQRDVFLWQGLDVVRGTYQDAIPALAHAVQHAANPGARRIQVDDECTVSGAPR